MYLKNVGLKNFRSFDQGEIELQKDLTIFAGENNGGKSNGIDAIRLLTLPIGGRREIYCEATDVRFQSASKRFDLQATYADLSAGQQGRFISAVTDASMTEARFGLVYNGSKLGARPNLWAGKEGSLPEPGCHDWVRHLYLPPLRDAKRALASGNPTRIMALLHHFLEGTTQEQLAKELARKDKHDVLDRVDKAVEKGLTAMTAGVRQQSASLGFGADERLMGIARDLRFKLADHGVMPEDLQFSGHGYANLLFMAIIAVELEKVRAADLTLFLVEEPEAHLHPQLQAAVLSFLRDQAEQSRKVKSSDHGPAGEIQVVVATHSPNLSAWVESDRLVVFRSAHTVSGQTSAQPHTIEPTVADAAVIESGVGQDDLAIKDGEAGAIAAAMTAAALRRSTRCVALARMALDPGDRRKVDRYLDVTKSAMLFGGRVLLVEGIAEALLIPVMAKTHTLKGQVEQLRRFRSTTFVPIDGVDFKPYARLLLTAVSETRIADRLVIVTDGDKVTSGEDEEEEKQDGESGSTSASDPAAAPTPQALLIPGEARKLDLEALAKELGASKFMVAISSTYSLEAELLEAGNNDIMRKAYLTLHRKSGEKWDKAVVLSGDDRAKALHKLFKQTRKGDFAQVLARLIEDGEAFKVPPYIEQAIHEVVTPE